MEPLLLHAGGVRTIAVHYEPVPHSRSQTPDRPRQREARRRRGAAPTAGLPHRGPPPPSSNATRSPTAKPSWSPASPSSSSSGTMHRRGASDPRTALARSCAEYEQVAAQAGIELRRLDGQHDLALALPACRSGAASAGQARVCDEEHPYPTPAATLGTARPRPTCARPTRSSPKRGSAPDGVYLGTNVLAGGSGFAYDPFEAYAAGLSDQPQHRSSPENPAPARAARPRCSSTAAVGVFGRWVAIADPKGEYLPLGRGSSGSR